MIEKDNKSYRRQVESLDALGTALYRLMDDLDYCEDYETSMIADAISTLETMYANLTLPKNNSFPEKTFESIRYAGTNIKSDNVFTYFTVRRLF